ncbi:MAG: phosphodiester glycosidase family protein [Anaerolineae bacterium]|nr:phosphodiester glycosidase family protein [Anaerolineae bacterium]
MLFKRLISRRLLAGLLAGVALLGCNLSFAPGSVARDPSPGVVIPTDTLLPSPLPPLTSPDGWQPVIPGMERRDMPLPGSGQQMKLVRLDPAWVTFRVLYSPGAPRSLDEWRDALPGALVIVNAAFFNPEDYAIGLLVSDGQVYGQSLTGYGGMFQVDAVGGVRVRSLVSEPYWGEMLTQAAQGFPMLLEVGGGLAPSGDGFDDRSRRTFVAQDRASRIIFGVIPNGLISLNELQQGLYDSGLDLVIAVGLDGGRSTGMVVSVPENNEMFPALDRLPSVIAVYSR